MCWTVYLVLSVLSLSLGSVTTASGQIPRAGVIRALKGNVVGQCPSVEERERARNEIHQIVTSVIATTASTTNDTAYSICNGTPGWRRVAFINMTDTSYSCPTGLSLTSYSKRTCGRFHTHQHGCSSTTFSVGGLPYSQVCGRIRGYQFGETTAFNLGSQGIEGYYVDGISLTHGDPGSRQHIWTFAVGLDEVSTSFPSNSCPCDSSAQYNIVPTFVGNDYFCESGLNTAYIITYNYIFYPNDVLWDGQNCISTSTCCQFNNPPWFTKNLPNATTDDIELRICIYHNPFVNDVPLELIELYVQ